MEPTLSQTLHFLAGETIPSQVSAGRVVAKALEAQVPPQALIEELYIRALSRKPEPRELAELLELIGAGTRDRKVYEDIFCGLLGSTEFLFNH
jgi:hypothetical protein